MLRAFAQIAAVNAVRPEKSQHREDNRRLNGAILLAIVSVLLTYTIAPMAAGAMIGITWSGYGSGSPLVWIDEQTGTVFRQVEVPAFKMNSLARDASGAFYTVADDQLITVDPYTGQVTPIATVDLGGDAISIRALAFAPSGELYATNQPDINAGAPPMDFYRIDISTGVGTLIGENVMYSQSLVFSSEGVLYGYELGPIMPPVAGAGLVTIDVATGLYTDVDPLVEEQALIQSLAFAPDGRLYGYRDVFYEVDRLTGELTSIGPGGLEDIRGLAFIPEPGSVGLFGLGWVLWIRQGKSRRTRQVRVDHRERTNLG